MHDTSRTIEIAVKFGNLTAAEADEFKTAVTDGFLVIAREFGGPRAETGDYFVFARVNQVFEEFRSEQNGTKRRTIFAGLRKQYPEISAATGEEMDVELRNWEANNPDQLQSTRVRGFFGARNVANGKLKKKTSVRTVPAVKEATEEATDSKKSPIIGLLNEIVRQTFENRKDFSDFVAQSNNKIAELTDPSTVPQLSGISDRLTQTVGRYYSDTGLIADLNKANELTVTFPSPLISVLHRGLKVDVSQVGHGLQRAIFFSLVQFLAEEQTEKGSDGHVFKEAQSDIILLIEEPEIYQHPLKQSLFYDAFKEICSGFSIVSGIRIQIIFATHSEKFVRLRDIDKVRLISKRPVGDSYVTLVKALSIAQFSSGMAALVGSDIALSDEAFSAGLHIFSREVSEGFFADQIILVEGVSDKAILEGMFLHLGYDPYRDGISIIPVDGKTKLDKPLFAFRALGIPVYTVFDNDKSARTCKDSVKRNRVLQTICRSQNIEDFPVGVFSEFCCFDGNLESYVKSLLKEEYKAIIGEVSAAFEVSAREVVKTPAVVQAFLKTAIDRGHEFTMLSQLIKTVRSRIAV
ncbi:hypothetical protein ASG25_11960 [Rhizobium sp. Leaf384]|nr:hypothetical protein ASG25_11960 [Rhizobium sp. Leaf384]KQS82833.1 hypothetical protein ASG58_05775 [Rhizobium sp. Leaf383]